MGACLRSSIFQPISIRMRSIPGRMILRDLRRNGFVCDAVVIKPTIPDHHQEFDHYFDGSFSGRNSPIRLKYGNISARRYERMAPCMEASRRLCVNSDGNVWCGHHNSEDFGSHLGNIYKQGLREIWHGAEMNEFAEHTRSGRFHRTCCKLCGNEIRETVRDRPAALEKEIRFGGWGNCGLRFGAAQTSPSGTQETLTQCGPG